MGREISSIELVRQRMVDRVLVVLAIVIVPGVMLSWSRALVIGVKPMMWMTLPSQEFWHFPDQMSLYRRSFSFLEMVPKLGMSLSLLRFQITL